MIFFSSVSPPKLPSLFVQRGFGGPCHLTVRPVLALFLGSLPWEPFTFFVYPFFSVHIFPPLLSICDTSVCPPSPFHWLLSSLDPVILRLTQDFSFFYPVPILPVSLPLSIVPFFFARSSISLERVSISVPSSRATAALSSFLRVFL